MFDCYNIIYRVNGGTYQTLADNLNTLQNYTLDVSRTALGLASDQKVTEIMFVFGRVPSGFTKIQDPQIHVLTGNVTTAFSNTVYVGGLYGEEWIQGVSRWTTKVYYVPEKLPQTGY